MTIKTTALAAFTALLIASAAAFAAAQTEGARSDVGYGESRQSTPSSAAPGQTEEDLRDASGARPAPGTQQRPGTYQGQQDIQGRPGEVEPGTGAERRGKGWLVAGGVALAMIIFFMTRRKRVDTDKRV